MICRGKRVLSHGVYQDCFIFLMERDVEINNSKCGTNQNKDEKKYFHLSPRWTRYGRIKKLGYSTITEWLQLREDFFDNSCRVLSLVNRPADDDKVDFLFFCYSKVGDTFLIACIFSEGTDTWSEGCKTV